MRKPYEYDYNKKERQTFLTILSIILIAGALLLAYRLFIYQPPVDIFVAPTTDENPSWVLEDISKPLESPLINTKEERSAINYYNVLAEFRVETALRYQPTENKTFCNTYAWDVASAMNVKLPYYLTKTLMMADDKDYYYVASANVYADFLEKRGAEYGWRLIEEKEAQERANEGYLTIGVWQNSNAEKDVNEVTAHYPAGHIFIVRPQPTGSTYSARKGPFIAQAGEFNTLNANVSDVFNLIKRLKVVYYTHD